MNIFSVFSHNNNPDSLFLGFMSAHSSCVTAEPVNVLVACGPYTPSDSLTFDPLLDLINVIVRDHPDVCILVRLPFLLLYHNQLSIQLSHFAHSF